MDTGPHNTITQGIDNVEPAHTGGEWEEAQRSADNVGEGEDHGANATETVGVISSA